MTFWRLPFDNAFDCARGSSLKNINRWKRAHAALTIEQSASGGARRCLRVVRHEAPRSLWQTFFAQKRNLNMLAARRPSVDFETPSQQFLAHAAKSTMLKGSQQRSREGLNEASDYGTTSYK